MGVAVSQPKYVECDECVGGVQTVYAYHRQNFTRDVGYIESRDEPCEVCGGEGQLLIEDDEEC